MTVEVRLFAALRDAAGVARLTSEAAGVTELHAELVARFGEPFGSRLARSKTVVDGEEVAGDAALADGAEVALLPPFSGG